MGKYEYDDIKSAIDFARQCVNNLTKKQILQLLDRIEEKVDRFYDR